MNRPIRMREMPEREQPLSEQFRLIAKAWVDLDGAARMLESCREVTFSQMVKARGDIPVARAEREAKASAEWAEYVKKMVEARTAANLKKIQLEFIRMRHMEATSMEATARAERRM